MRPIIRFVSVRSQCISGSFGPIHSLHAIPDLQTASVPIEEAKAPFQCSRAQIIQIKRRIKASRAMVTCLVTRLLMDEVHLGMIMHGAAVTSTIEKYCELCGNVVAPLSTTW